MLSDSESDTESLHRLTINEHYAKAFAYKKEREELAKLKEKYGSDPEEDDLSSETDSEEAESEDEDGDELTPAVDAAILRTLARIKRKDPSIYSAEKDIFEEEQKKTRSLKLARASKDKSESKPVTIRQARLESTLNPTSRSPSPQPITHVEEQRLLRNETIAVFHNAVEDDGNNATGEDDDDDDDDLLVLREKSKDELEKEEEQYRAFLEREVGGDLAELVTVEESIVNATDEVMMHEAPKKKGRRKEKDYEQKGKRKQDKDQEFLVNYILNRGWIDHSAQRVPTYREITGLKGKIKDKRDLSNDGDLDSEHSETTLQAKNIDGEGEEMEDDQFEELVDRFESSYNFRFEEPDAAVIKSYPRNLPSLVRREDTTRKEARERRKKRKEEELLTKKEEVRRLKGLKMKELRAKLERIGHEGGKDVDKTKALQDLNLEGDWDPDVHDEQMAGLYGDGYGEGDDGFDEEKPQWDDDIDIDDLTTLDSQRLSKKAKKKVKKKKEKEVVDGVDIDAMDADIETVEDDEWDGTEEMRKKKVDEYMDEIYGLEFNDIIGSMPTRFKYTPVQPQSFALTPVEILMATDAELNQYMGVKKYAPYRKDTRWDSKRGERLKELKQKIAERDGVSVTPEAHPAKKRKGKKERLKMKALAFVQAEDGSTTSVGAFAGNETGETMAEKRKHPDVANSKDEGSHEVGGGRKRRKQRKVIQE